MLELESLPKSKQKTRSSRVAALLLDLISDSVRGIRRELSGKKCDSEKCVTLAQFRVLANLWLEPMTNKALSELIGTSVPATSKMVKLLSQKGLIERMPSTHDKREALLRLTPLGNLTYKQGLEKLELLLSDRLQNLSSENLMRAEAGLSVLRGIFEQPGSTAERIRPI